MKKDLLQSIKIIIIGLILSAGLSFASPQTTPLSSLLSGNPEKPITVSGATPQAKGGPVPTNTNSPPLLYVYGTLSASNLAVFGNATLAGNVRVKNLSQASNSSITTWPAPVCAADGSNSNIPAGTLIICAPSAAVTCGSANGGTFPTKPTTNLCSDGSTPPVSGGSNGPWTWTCGTAQCSATKTSTQTLTASLSASPSTGPAPLSVTLTATAGGTAPGSATYKFKCKSDPQTSYSSSQSANTYSCTYQTAGTYTASVEITKGSLTATGTTTVTVTAPQTLTATLSASPSSGKVSLNVTLAATAGGTAIGTTYYQFKCDSGDSWHPANATTTSSHSCNYSTHGIKNASVKITRGNLTATANTTVTVTDWLSVSSTSPTTTSPTIGSAGQSCQAAVAALNTGPSSGNYSADLKTVLTAGSTVGKCIYVRYGTFTYGNQGNTFTGYYVDTADGTPPGFFRDVNNPCSNCYPLLKGTNVTFKTTSGGLTIKGDISSVDVQTLRP